MLADVPADAVTPLLRAAFRGYIGFVEATSLDWVERRELERDQILELLSGSLFAIVDLVTSGAVRLT
jgi:hypothetical protein